MHAQYNFIRLDFNILVFCIWHNNMWFNCILRWEPFVMHFIHCHVTLQPPKIFLIAHCNQSVTLNLLIGSWWKYRDMIGDLGWLIVRSDLQESRRIKKCTSNQCDCLLQDHLRHAHDHPVPQLYLLFWECQDYNNIHLLQCNHVLCYQSSPILTKKMCIEHPV